MNITKIIFLFIIGTNLITAQSEIFLPRQYLSFSIAGGISIAYTDYVNTQVGPAFRSGIEYYVFPHADHRIGLGFQFGYQELRGQDNRLFMSSNDGPRITPPSFSTIVISPGFFSNYSYFISDRFSVFGRMGFTYNVFNPKDNLGADASGYNEGLYSQDFFTFIPEAGFNFRISDNIELSAALNYALPVTDYLDDISAGIYKDAYSNILLEFSYSFTDISYDKSAVLSDGIKNGTADNKYNQSDENRLPVVNIDSQNKYKPIKEILDEIVQLKTFNEILIPTDDAFFDNTGKFKIDVYPELDRIVNLINAEPASRWRIEGHTDNQGEKYELRKLSLERARAVYDYFVSKNFEPGRLRIYGLADDYPIGDNNNFEGRRLNRRIMIIRETSNFSIIQNSVEPSDATNGFAERFDPSNLSEESASDAAETFNQFILRGDDTFDSNSASLKEVAKFLLDEIVKYLMEDPGAKWKIEGYMDNQGSAEFLKKLSTERAKTIYDYLITNGIPALRLSYEGFGSNSPISNNNTEEGRSANRRVLIIREK